MDQWEHMLNLNQNLATDSNKLNQLLPPDMAQIFGEKKFTAFEIEPLPWMRDTKGFKQKKSKAKKTKQPKPDADFSPTFEIEPMPGFNPGKTKKHKMKNGASKLHPRTPVKK